MQFLRSQGIAHMDLKPQNLLLTAPPKVSLKIGGQNYFTILSYALSNRFWNGTNIACRRSSRIFQRVTIVHGM